LLIPGTKVGDLTVETALGSGALSVVYRVRQDETQRRYALKVMRLALDKGGQYFFDQAQPSTALAHPGIVAVRDRIEVGPCPGLLQELVEGPSLSAWIAQMQPSVEQALEVFRELLAAVSHAHRVGVVHLDLKPQNVLMHWAYGGWRPRVMDFGIAKLAVESSAGSSGIVIGTPGYLAPEMVSAPKQGGVAADIFGLGAILYELVTGEPAFPQPSASARLQAIDDEEYRLPQWLVPELPVEISQAIVGCLRRQPEHRYASVAALAAVLPRAPKPLPISEQPTELYVPQEADSGQRSHVPPTLDAFVGREADLARLHEWASGKHQVLTIKGHGGIGKTRLARHFAETTRWRYPGGVWFIDLTSSRDQATMLRTVAQVIGVPLDPSRGTDQLGRVLRSTGRTLVVLDNLEQIAAVARGVVQAWVRASSQLHVLQTSRRLLELADEQVLELGPLGAKTARQLLDARIADVHPSLSLSAKQGAAAAQIVEELQGIPLAIELVAARASAMDPTEILQHVYRLQAGSHARLHTSTSDVHGRPSGSDRMVDSCLDWTWSLLSEVQKQVLCTVSVFEGGFTVEAAQAVVGPVDDLEARDILSLLQELESLSLIRVENPGLPGVPGRLHVADPVREHALQFLKDRARVQTRHAEYFSRFGSLEFHGQVCAHGATARYHSLLLEIDNLARATEMSVVAGRDDLATQLLCAGDLLVDRGFRWPGWRGMLEDVYTRAPEDAPRRALLARMLGWEFTRHGDWNRSVELFSEGLMVAERSEQQAQGLLNRVGLSYALRMGREMVRAYAAVSPVPGMAKALGLDWIQVRALMAVANLIPGDAEMKKCIEHLQDAIVIASQAGDIRGEIAGTVNLATVLASRGLEDEADASIEAILPKVPRLGPSRLEAEVMSIAGIRTLRRGQVDLAVERLRRAGRLIVALGEHRKKALVRVRLMRALAAQGSTDEVERLRHEVFADGSLGRLDSSTRYEVWVNLAHVALVLGNREALETAMGEVEAILSGDPSAHVAVLYGGDLSTLRAAVAQGSVSEMPKE